MTRRSARDNCILLTGATGFLGHCLLAELLRRRLRCAVLLRPPVKESLHRLALLLSELGIRVDEEVARSNLVVVEGDLGSALPDTGAFPITSIVHVAAATNFSANPAGDLERTNVAGTRRVLEWARRWGVDDVHLVSSAYVCGRATGPVVETFNPSPPSFHNDYERSKWEAERLGRDRNLTLTVYRPSILVGAFASGRATKFGGFYLSARATDLLDRMHRGSAEHVRRSIPLRISGRGDDCQNIVPVDYVARMMATIIGCPSYHGRVYHLVHPDPPSNFQIKRAFERYFKIGGGRFVDPREFARNELNEHERSFDEISRPIEHYFTDSPHFLRSNAARVERQERIVCPAYDIDALVRLVRYAQAAQWGKREAPEPTGDSECAAYFESYLPTNIARSKVAAQTAVSATVRFIIEDEPRGEWVCRFERGSLGSVHRGPNGMREDFGFKTTRAVFREAITGRVHPQEFFLTGRAEVFGDVERALKMAMILHAFTNEFPCGPHDPLPTARSTCTKK